MDTNLLEAVFSEALYSLEQYFKFAFSGFVLFYLVLKKPLWFRKIQQKMPRFKDYGREVFFSAISVLIFGLVSATVLFVYWDETTLYKESYDQYGHAYYWFTFVWLIILHDTYFYWLHRAMHSKLLFKYVHKVHHASRNPSPWTAYSFHPLEAFLEALIIPIMAFTLPVHISTITSVLLFQIVYNVYAHLGFEILPKGASNHVLGKYINTGVAHNLHHSRFTGNYGLYFLFWDRLCGTVRKDYDESYRVVTSRPLS